MKATKIQYQEFLSSFVWEDLKSILKERIEDVRRQIEIAVHIDSMQELHRTTHERGRLEELRYLSELPGFIIENFGSLVKYDKAAEIAIGGEENARG